MKINRSLGMEKRDGDGEWESGLRGMGKNEDRIEQRSCIKRGGMWITIQVHTEGGSSIKKTGGSRNTKGTCSIKGKQSGYSNRGR
jgi:hypothetical protein